MKARRLILIPAVVASSAAAATSSCTQEVEEVDVRSLERSGRVAFVCLGAPDAPGGAALPLDACGGGLFEDASDFSGPHLYALVTQTIRGEIAVVDTSLAPEAGPVLDQNPIVPGRNFLPIAAQPIDIAALPDGRASFVTVAEVGRQGIYVLDSDAIRPRGDRAPATLTTWPACALPSTPGHLIIVDDPARDGSVRETCDGPYTEASTTGRPKLVVTLPDEGGFAVIDAQSLLERGAGTFEACAIERWIPLESSVGHDPEPPIEDLPACVVPPVAEPVFATYSARPAGMTLSGGRLYVGDHEAPVIHRIELASPCEPVEIDPLLPIARDEPDRLVTVSRLAATPGLTSDLKRYLYAVDFEDGSTMVFDISDGASDRKPLVRKNPEHNPFQPRDRIKFVAPARDVAIFERDVAEANPLTGVAQEGVRCDPDPAKSADPSSPAFAVEALYRTSADYEAGAGPFKLRGSFAAIVLSSGQIAIIDVEDLDDACRGPTNPDPIFGCDGPPPPEVPLATSDEASCGVVVPNTPRAATYLVTNDRVGPRRPGVQTFPQLFNEAGTLIPPADPLAPRMRATMPPGVPAPELTLAVGSEKLEIPPDGVIKQDEEARHTLVPNLEDPRVHIADQAWSLTYEGTLPGFGGKRAELRIGSGFASVPAMQQGLWEPNSAFCDAGVQSQAAIREKLAAEGFAGDVDAEAARLADLVQILDPIPAETDDHWGTVTACTFQQCDTDFGLASLPPPQRELPIVEAFQDHLVLGPSRQREIFDPARPLISADHVKCCFPTLTAFAVRAAGQWVLVGEGSGFLHHVIATPGTGECRESCDPMRQRRNARVREVPPAADEQKAVVHDGDPRALLSPNFRLAITSGRCTPAVDDCECPPDAEGKPQAQCPVPSGRDYQFRMVTTGSFATMVVNLNSEDVPVQPQGILPLPITRELVVTDGSLGGILFVSTDSVDLRRQFF